MRVPPRLALALALASALGCLSPAQRREESLTRVSRELVQGLRWGRYDRVAPHLTSEDARLLQQRLADAGSDLAMADTEITSMKVDEDAEHATVFTDVSWYSQRQSLLRTATLEQQWEWNGPQGRWICVAQRRVRGDRFPLVPEPLASTPSSAPPTAAPGNVSTTATPGATPGRTTSAVGQAADAARP